MILSKYFHNKNQFRAMLLGHKAAEVAIVCVLVMAKGHIGDVTVTHLVIASKTGLLTVCPSLAVSYTRYARYFANRWASSAFVGVCTFFADFVVHHSHYSWKYTDATLTAIGAFIFSVAISYTPVGKQVDRLAEAFLHHRLATP